MATLILGTVGTIIGGPLGGAIGSFLGSQLDSAIIGNGPDREGPRLAEVSLQTSSYGTAIPQIFGDMRSAGSVIWATDLVENSNREGGGKGRPASVTFSYAANFAVALSSRPIASIGRIWADGNLLRGAGGDFKTETIFRFYSGHEDQDLDPLIASAEGINNTPAHRGIAYAVFENLQLADFGNRIPSLSFEIINGEGRLEIIRIARAISDGLISENIDGNNIDDNQVHASLSILGYAASESSSREAIDNLIAPLPISIRACDKRLALVEAIGETVMVNAPIAKSQNQERFENMQIISVPINEIPKESALRYYDPMREYQAGLQSSRRPGPGRKIATINFPAAIEANDARDIVRSSQLQDIFARHSLTITLVRDDMNAPSYHSGDLIGFAHLPYIWRINQVEQDLGVVQLNLQAISGNAIGNRMPRIESNITPFAAGAGRSNNAIDERAGQTLLRILDLPALTAGNIMTPIIAVAAAGTEAGWRKANLFAREGGNVNPLPGISTASVMGIAKNRLGPASPFVWDRKNKPVIQLAHDRMILPLGIGSTNLASSGDVVQYAMIGDEIISFERAELLDNGDYILHDLCRGVGGTEAFISNHQQDEQFVLLENDRLQFLSSDNYQLGQSLTIEALGLDDEIPQSDMIDNIGRSLRPLPPVHLQVRRMLGGDAMVSWTRRSRMLSRWSDDVDIPLGEDSEQYALSIIVNDGVNDSVAGTSETVLVDSLLGDRYFTISSDQISRWRADNIADVIISVAQIGTYARSEYSLIRHKFSS